MRILGGDGVDRGSHEGAIGRAWAYFGLVWDVFADEWPQMDEKVAKHSLLPKIFDYLVLY